ncbi:MAG: alternate-type signal peptide domain-containing protein [Actinomycetaceae bacterium]
MRSTPRLGRATLAAALAVVLLSGTGGTAASWLDTATVPSAGITSGRLEIEPVTQSFTVTRPGSGSPFDLGSAPLHVGDTITMTSTVRVRAAGDALDATLALDTSNLTYSIDQVDLSDLASVSTSSSLPSAGGHAFGVTGDDDGATATATVTWHIPATTDGRAPASDRSNWWGGRLQGQAVDPGHLGWTVRQGP